LQALLLFGGSWQPRRRADHGRGLRKRRWLDRVRTGELLLLELLTEPRELLLHRRELGQQRTEQLAYGQGGLCCTGLSRWWPAGSWLGRRLGLAGDQGTAMSHRQLLELLGWQAFAAPIGRMGLKLELGRLEPAAKRFGINSEPTTTVGYSQ
jgi:hypothetical protein